ncbi:unnamed protein product [Fusarium graminearum]|nr:unnamed protein product [Fusarium graminearum]CAF3573559.1 unnamed protein product [Fusarium graminearum]
MLRIKDLLNPFTKVRIRDILNPIEEPERPGPSNQEDRPKKCSNCSRPAVKDKSKCEACRAGITRNSHKIREIRKQEGICTRCPERLDRIGTMCRKCNESNKERMRVYRSKRGSQASGRGRNLLHVQLTLQADSKHEMTTIAIFGSRYNIRNFVQVSD